MEDLIKAFGEWLRVEKGFSNHTVRNYVRDVELFFEFVGNNPYDVTPEKVIQFSSFMAKHRLKPSSIARRLSSIRTFYRFLKIKGFATNTPIGLFRLPKLRKKLPAYLTIEEVKKALEAAKSPLEKAIIELLYSTGMRVSELCMLNLDDVDLSGSRIRVRGKGKRERIVFLTEEAVKAIREYLAYRMKRLSEGNYSEDAKNALFITIKGRISDMTVRRIVSKVFRLSGVKKRVYPHLIRHTFATHLLEEGMNLKGVQELLGHKNIQTTEVYTHVSIKRLVDVYNKFHPRSQGPIYNGNSHKEE